jgi:hypothetical protein
MVSLATTLILFYLFESSYSFTIGRQQHALTTHSVFGTRTFLSNDWSSFAALEDDDEETLVDKNTYAKEEDSQELKAQVGASLEAPSILDDYAPPISVPAGTYNNALRRQ